MLSTQFHHYMYSILSNYQHMSENSIHLVKLSKSSFKLSVAQTITKVIEAFQQQLIFFLFESQLRKPLIFLYSILLEKYCIFYYFE